MVSFSVIVYPFEGKMNDFSATTRLSNSASFVIPESMTATRTVTSGGANVLGSTMNAKLVATNTIETIRRAVPLRN